MKKYPVIITGTIRHRSFPKTNPIINGIYSTCTSAINTLYEFPYIRPIISISVPSKETKLIFNIPFPVVVTLYCLFIHKERYNTTAFIIKFCIK